MTKRRQKLRYSEFQAKRKRDKAILRMAGYKRGTDERYFKPNEIYIQVYYKNGKWRSMTPYLETTELCKILNSEYQPNGNNPET